MREDFSFKYVGFLPSFDELLKLVESFSDEDWRRYKDRKIRGGAAAEKTDTIPIIYNPNPSADKLIHHEIHNAISKYIEELRILCIPIFGETSVRQSMLTNLRAGVEIKRHRDMGPITAKSHRVHLAVKTNELCLFSVAEESMNIAAGQAWAIDNTDKYHSVINGGTTDRIHLIVDLVSVG
jgi:aspartyl/asparaginyl beta-hydroxylase (cupin superfamily)